MLLSTYLHNQIIRILSVSTAVSLPDPLDIIEHQPAEAEAGDAREAHEHVDCVISLQAPGKQRPNCGADGSAAVNDGGDGGYGLARALINAIGVLGALTIEWTGFTWRDSC